MVLCATNPIFSDCNNHEKSSFLTNNDVKNINLIKCVKCNTTLLYASLNNKTYYSSLNPDKTNNIYINVYCDAIKAFSIMRRTYKGWLKHEKFSNKLIDQISNYLDKIMITPDNADKIETRRIPDPKTIKLMCTNAGYYNK